MKVLTASAGNRRDDFCQTVAGELVMFGIECATPERAVECGCIRAWDGLASGGATTVVEVTDRPDVDLELLTQLIDDALTASGWTDVAGWAAAEAEDIAETAAQHPEGTRLRRTRDLCEVMAE